MGSQGQLTLIFRVLLLNSSQDIATKYGDNVLNMGTQHKGYLEIQKYFFFVTTLACI